MEQNGKYKLTVENRLTRLEVMMLEIKDNHLKHIEDKIDNLSIGSVTSEMWEEHLEKDDDHEKRIRIIEQFMWRRIGATAAISSIASALLTLLAQYLFIK